MNINRISIVVHFSSCIIFSQWSSFQIENMNNADSYKTNGLAALISSSQYYPFDNEKNFIDAVIIDTNDAILLFEGGHGIEVIEESKFIEFKQGPYIEDMDKKHF